MKCVFFKIWKTHLQLIFLKFNYVGIFLFATMTEGSAGIWKGGQYAGQFIQGRIVPPTDVS